MSNINFEPEWLVEVCALVNESNAKGAVRLTDSQLGAFRGVFGKYDFNRWLKNRYVSLHNSTIYLLNNLFADI